MIFSTSVTSNAVAGALNGKLNNTMPIIQGSEVDGLSASEIGIFKVHHYGIGWVSNDGMLIHIPWSNAFAYQIAVDDQTNWLAVRFKANGSWYSWKVLSGAEEDDAGIIDITNSVSAGLGASYVGVCRRNNLVYMEILGGYSGGPTLSTQAFISGLPAKYTPRFAQNFAVVSYKGDGMYVYPSRIEVNPGKAVLLLETSMPNGTALRMGFIYLV